MQMSCGGPGGLHEEVTTGSRWIKGGSSTERSGGRALRWSSCSLSWLVWLELDEQGEECREDAGTHQRTSPTRPC